MSDEAFNRQRRSLNILSSALIFYFITGAEFIRGASFLGLSITHEVVAYTLVWVAFAYLWWRFYLFGEASQQRWKLDFHYKLSKSRRFRSLYQQPESDSQNQLMVWAPNLHGEGFRRYLSWEKAYLIGIGAEDGQIQFADPSTFSESINPLTQKWNVGPETVIPLKWRQYFLPALKATISSITSRNGTDWVLPNLLACFALVCGISSLIMKVS